MNRYWIIDNRYARVLHIGYDTKASAKRACRSINMSTNTPGRYSVIDTSTDRKESKPHATTKRA